MQEPPPNDRHYCDRNRARAQNEIGMHVWMGRGCLWSWHNMRTKISIKRITPNETGPSSCATS